MCPETLESRLPLASHLVINEIHFDPDVKTEPVEFIELMNAGDQSQDLGGWSLADAISFTFPEGTVLPSGGFLIVAQDPAAVQQKFAVDALGPFVGKLSNEGERLVLQDGSGQVQDEVSYRLGYPWPTVGDAPGNSIELTNSQLDNDLAGSWRSSLTGPTPNAANSQFAVNSAPQTRQQKHSPEQPTSDDEVVISIKVTDPDGVADVQMEYQSVAPGDYIAIDDPRYALDWTAVSMRDDGQQGDRSAGDDVYTVTLPATLQQHRYLMRYRFTVSDTRGQSVAVPYADDPVPNFAYYVYDGVPDYTASVRPGVEPTTVYSSEMLQQVQVYQLITAQQSVNDAQQINGPAAPPYLGNDYPWRGTMVVDGKVYDHIGFRVRGGVNRYRRGKNAWKIDFNRGQSLQARDNNGVEYDTTWDNLNLSHIGNTNQLGNHYMNEALSMRLFQLAGVEAANTNFIHLRIVQSADENPEDQYQTDFRGLYLAVEQPDGRMLDQHGLPDGNLYKLGQDGDLPGGQNNQGPTQPDDGSDLVQFVAGIRSRESGVESWWRDNFDVDRYYSYRSILEAVRQYDVNATNQLYFNNPETGKWSVHPWDVDLTWRNVAFGSGADAFGRRFLGMDVFKLEYNNRLREITDLLFNRDQVDMLIDEVARFIYSPTEPSFVDADRAMWDYNPILEVAPISGTGLFYDVGTTQDFEGMLQVLRDYVDVRTKFIYSRVIRNDDDAPQTPSISYMGPESFPVNQLAISTTEFASSRGAAFAEMQWRIAEVTDLAAEQFDPSQPRKYEIDAAWQSDGLTTFESDFTFPSVGLAPGATYRVRARMKDDAGMWSHWSEPIQFVAGPAQDPVVQNLRITEINYHPQDPPPESPLDDAQFEFLEFQNTGGQPLDVTDVTISDGVRFAFQGPTTQLLDASFANGADGFVYSDDPLNTINPDFADGALGEGEENDGAIGVRLGPGLGADPVTLVDSVFDDPQFIFAADLFNGTNNPASVNEDRTERLELRLDPRPDGGASAGWQREIDLPRANVVRFSLDYELIVGQTLESSEFGEVIFEVDGQRYGMGENQSIAHLPGKQDPTTGRVAVEFDVALEAGEHTITIGAFNNQAAADDEIVTFRLYDLIATLPEPGAIGPTSGGWSQTITLPRDGRLLLDASYRIVQSAALEPSEISELVVLIDGERFELGVDETPLRFVGGSVSDSGWNRINIRTDDLSAGEYEVTLAVYNNGLTAADEMVDVYWDTISAKLLEPLILGPQEIVLVVADSDAFASRYGNGPRVVGEFASGRLNNGGEQIVVQNALGDIVQEFTYDDRAPWPSEADGDGATLEVIDPRGDANEPANWQASQDTGGSPGRLKNIPGDANRDGVFNSLDLVRVLQAGEFEDSLVGNSTFDEGDWNGDGEFTTADLVYVLQLGIYTVA